jgi:hypothetical protein
VKRSGLHTIVVALAVALVVASCAPAAERLPTGPWTEVARGEHVRYLQRPDARTPEEAAAAVQRLEGFLVEVGPHWSMPETISYYAFRDRADLRAATGWDTNGRALVDHDAVVSVHAADAHEVAHLLTAPAERPLRLANFWLEGIAMYYTWPEIYFDPEEVEARGLPRSIGVWSGRTVHEWARDARAAGALPPLASLAHGFRAFEALPTDVSYPAAGSFTTFLVGHHPADAAALAALRDFFRDANVAADVAEVEASFAAHFGTSLAKAEARWHAYLEDAGATADVGARLRPPAPRPLPARR